MTLDYVFEKCTGHKPEYWFERSELDWFEGYSDNREIKPKGLLVADWNDFPHGGRQWVKGIGYPDTIVTPNGIKQNGTSSEAMRRFERILERLGYELDWRDEVSRCSDCNRAIQTNADSFFWRPEYYTSDEGDTCLECIRKNRTSEYLEHCRKESVPCQFPDLDFRANDYYPIAAEYPTEVSDVRKLYGELRAQGYRDVVIVLTHKSDVLETVEAYELVEWEYQRIGSDWTAGEPGQRVRE